MTLKDEVIDKLDEYGVDVLQSYDMDDNIPGYVLHLKDMIIFIDENQNDISMSFEITMRPEDVAKMTLILREIGIEGYTYSIMESYTYNESGDLLLGEEAEQYLQDEFIVECEHQFAMSDMLNNIEGLSEC